MQYKYLDGAFRVGFGSRMEDYEAQILTSSTMLEGANGNVSAIIECLVDEDVASILKFYDSLWFVTGNPHPRGFCIWNQPFEIKQDPTNPLKLLIQAQLKYPVVIING